MLSVHWFFADMRRAEADYHAENEYMEIAISEARADIG